MQVLFAEIFRAQAPSADSLYKKAMENIFCTYEALNTLYYQRYGPPPNQPPKKLASAFQAFTGRAPLSAHEALDDTIMLVYLYFELAKATHPRVRLPEPGLLRLVAQLLRAPQSLDAPDRRVRRRLE